MISGHAISHHLHADDNQLHVSFASGDSTAALDGLQSCLASVHSWMLTNILKLNPDKTEFILIGNEREENKYLSTFPIEHFGVKTNPAESARNLGEIFDHISPSAHIYQQSAAHACTMSGICGVFTITLIWIVQNYLQLALCLVTSIIAIHFCMVSPTAW